LNATQIKSSEAARSDVLRQDAAIPMLDNVRRQTCKNEFRYCSAKRQSSVPDNNHPSQVLACEEFPKLPGLDSNQDKENQNHLGRISRIAENLRQHADVPEFQGFFDG
jgi:hypothetical protein